MNLKFQNIIITSAASLLTFTALAQETTLQSKPDEPGFTRQGITQARVDRMNDTVKSSDIIGMKVNNYQGEKIGKLEDLVVDVEHGRIVQVILSTGEFSGMPGMMTAAPPRAFHYDVADNILQLETSKEKLKMAPTFQPESWNEGTQSNREAELYVYYGNGPAFISSSNNVWITNTDGRLTRTSLRNESLTNNADGTETAVNTNRMLKLGDTETASSLIGMSVKNLQDENIGKVDNLLLDLPTGRIVAVIISSGGFLGMGGVLSPIPPTAFQFSTEEYLTKRFAGSSANPMNLQHTSDQNGNGSEHSSAASPNNGISMRYTSTQEVLVLDASKKMIGAAPHFKADQWPDFGQPSYVGGVYRAYNVEPYLNTNAITQPVKISSN